MQQKSRWKWLLVAFLLAFVIGGYLGTEHMINDMERRAEELREEIEVLKDENRKLRQEYREEVMELEKIQRELLDFFDDLEILEVEVTAYTKECGYPWDDGVTYTGVRAVPYRTVAVDPGTIPLGSTVALLDSEGKHYVTAEAQDIGAAVKCNIVDLYVGEGDEALRTALRWGRKEMIAVVKK